MAEGLVEELEEAKVELAPLAGRFVEDGLPGGLEPAVVVADDEFHPPLAAVDEALKEGLRARRESRPAGRRRWHKKARRRAGRLALPAATERAGRRCRRRPQNP